MVVLSLIYFAPLWTHPTEIIHSKHSDIVNQHYPWRMFAVRSWHADHDLPLWTPWIYGGQPFQADAQTTQFYPPHAIFYFLPESWVGPLFGVMIWAHVLLAGIGMFAYARSRGLGPLPALVAGIGFMFAGKWLLHVLEAGHYVFVPLAWFPLLMLAVERGVAGQVLRQGVVAGCVLAMLLLGAHPQITLYAALLAGCLTLADVWLNGIDFTPRWKRWLATWLITAVVSVGLAAVQLLPTLEMAALTNRAHSVTPEYGAFYDWTIRNGREFCNLLLALAGPQNFAGNPWENVGAWGVLWMAMGLSALLLCRRPVVWIQGAVLLVMILFALGRTTPLYPALCRIVPFLSLFRIPARLLLFAGFPLGLLAGYLTQAVFVGNGERLNLRKILYTGATATAAVFIYFLASVDSSPPEYRYWWWILTVGAGGGIFFIALALVHASLPLDRYPVGRRLAITLAATGWLAWLTADLWGIHRHLVRTRPIAEVYPVNDAIRLLAEHPGGRVLDRPVNDGQPTFSPLTNGLCNLYGIEWVRGLNVTDLYRYKQFLNYISDQDTSPVLNEIPTVGPIVHQSLLDLLAVRYLVTPANLPLSASERREWQLVEEFRDNRVHQEVDSRRGGMQELPPFVCYERRIPLPRAFVVAEGRSLSSDSDRLEQLKQTDFRRTVLLENAKGLRGSPSPPAYLAFEGPAFQEATIVERHPNRLVIEVERQKPGYLVLLETWYPGWKCRTEGGEELTIWRANYQFRAVLLPAGHHRLEFRFEPLTFTVGKAITLTTGLLIPFWWLTFPARTILARRNRLRRKVPHRELHAEPESLLIGASYH
jgi:hypothetical protein